MPSDAANQIWQLLRQAFCVWRPCSAKANPKRLAIPFFPLYWYTTQQYASLFLTLGLRGLLMQSINKLEETKKEATQLLSSLL